MNLFTLVAWNTLVHKIKWVISSEPLWLASEADHQVKVRPPLRTQCTSHDEFHIFPMAICVQKQELALISQFLKYLAHLGLLLNVFFWVLEHRWEIPAKSACWEDHVVLDVYVVSIDSFSDVADQLREVLFDLVLLYHFNPHHNSRHFW